MARMVMMSSTGIGIALGTRDVRCDAEVNRCSSQAQSLLATRPSAGLTAARPSKRRPRQNLARRPTHQRKAARQEGAPQTRQVRRARAAREPAHWLGHKHHK